MITKMIPIYKIYNIPRSLVDSDTPVFKISHRETGTWQITDLSNGCVYTPQAFEAYYGTLPPPPPSANNRTRKEWYAHRKNHANDKRGRGRGFG